MLGALALWVGGAVSAALAAPAVLPASLLERIRALEADGRAHPRVASEALDRLLPNTAADSVERLELLTVQGTVLAIASIDDEAERVAVRLEAWGRDGTRPRATLAGAAAQLVRARMLIRGGDLRQADTLLSAAIERLPAELPATMRYRFVFARAYETVDAGRLEDGVRLSHQAVAIADRQDALWRQSEARTTLAYAYYRANQFERAARIAAEAVALSETARDFVSLARARNSEGIAADGLKDVAGERRAFEAAIEAARRADSKIDEVRFLANLADFYLQTAAYPTALHYAQLALPLARELRDRNTEVVAMMNLGLAQISMHQKALGMANVLAAVEIEVRRSSTMGAAENWFNAGRYLERAGDVADAVDAYHRYRRLVGQALREDQQKAIFEMQEQFDAESRTRALRLLERERAITAEQLHRRGLQLGIGGLATLVCLLSFAAVAELYRRTRQSARQLARRNETLKVEGEHDPLTGLANRRKFHVAMRERAPAGRLVGALFLIDIDHFKAVNDRVGHAAGDAVLVAVAERLRETLRDGDLLVRWGGEEFLVFVQGLATAQVDALAQRLLAALEGRAVRVDGRSLQVTGSIGFASFPLGAARLAVAVEPAINLVDAAMYLAKSGGRNRACGVAELSSIADAGALDAAVADLDAAVRRGGVRLTTVRGTRPASPVADRDWAVAA